AINVPPQTSALQVNIGTNKKGEFELRFQSSTPPGTYSFYLAGFHQGYRYSRNPQAAERAKQRQERIGKILSEAQRKIQQRQQDVNQRQSELQNASNELNQAKSKTLQANQAAGTAETSFKKAEQELKRKQNALAANPQDTAIKNQVDQLQVALKQADQKQQDAKTRAAAALKSQQEAEAKLKSAEMAKQQADRELQAARQFQQLAQQAKQRADRNAIQKRNDANPRNININVPSNSLTVKVVEFPIKVEAFPDQFEIRPGQQLEIPFKLARLYDFQSNVNIQIRLPGGVGGIGLQSFNLAADKSEGKLQISAQPGATAGRHQCTARLQMNFNGQNLTMERPFTLTVIAEPEPEN
ncbi:MAG: hypothetical protein MI861_15115, partial [Pirellulales bacterium]|nr:hypothetical protein [Pirellulales bacterium]